MMDLLIRLEATGLGTWVREAPTLWAYPTVLFLHTAGLGFLVGINVAMLPQEELLAVRGW